jgi:hypothetical protein
MTIYVRRPILRVYIDSREVTQVFYAKARYDLKARGVSSAEIVVPTVPSWARCYDPTTGQGSIVQIFMGPDEPHAYRRFVGYLGEISDGLYPEEHVLTCFGLLGKAERWKEKNPDGVDMANGGLGVTDTVQTTNNLDACGLTDAYLASIGCDRRIQGFGVVLGTQVTDSDAEGNLIGPFTRHKGDSVLDYQDRLDMACYPYRLWEACGTIFRTPIQYDHVSPSHTFTEGTNIFTANARETWLERSNQIVVTGYDDNTGLGPVEYSWPASDPDPCQPLAWDSGMIEWDTEANRGANNGLSCEAVAKAVRPDFFRALKKLENLETPSGEVIWPTHPILITGAGSVAGRLRLNQILWTQAAECEFSRQGEWTQRLNALGGVSGTLPTEQDPFASFSVFFEKEKIVVGGVETTLYTIYCRDTSAGMGATITSRAWTATSGTPSSGTLETFVTSFTDLSGKTIVLQVTDSNGNTGTRTLTMPAATSTQWVWRPIYLASKTVAEASDGPVFRTDAQSAGADVLVTTNGPVWGAGATAMASTDYLATSAPETTPFDGGATVTASWVENDVSTSRVALGASDGRFAISKDTAATWAVKAGPDANAVLRVVLSRWHLGAVYLLTSAGFYLSLDEGDTWSTLVAAEVGETFRDMCVSHTRQMIVMSGGRLACDGAGVAQTFAGTDPTDVIAVAADIIEDRFYAYDSGKNTWYTSADGGTEFGARTALPAAVVAQARGLWRDGVIRGLLYFAAGTAGAYKSLDGFGSAGGYFAIRVPGVGNCPADADVRQIGADGLLAAGAVTALTVVSDDQSKVLSLWNGASNDDPPESWTEPSFDDSGWAAATEGSAASISGATDIWDASLSNAAEHVLIRRTFTLSSGFISSGSLEIAADGQMEVWVNGMYLAHRAAGYANATTLSVPPELLNSGTNVLAIWVKGTS